MTGHYPPRFTGMLQIIPVKRVRVRDVIPNLWNTRPPHCLGTTRVIEGPKSPNQGDVVVVIIIIIIIKNESAVQRWESETLYQSEDTLHNQPMEGKNIK